MKPLWKLSILVTGILAAISSPSGAISPNTCGCRNSSGNFSISTQSGPPGICSVAQADNICSFNQIQIGQDWSYEQNFRGLRGQSLNAAVQAAGVSLPAGEALRIAALLPPEQYQDRLPDVLTVLLALSIGQEAGPGRLSTLHNLLAANQMAIAAAFTSPVGDQSLPLGLYRAEIGYGRIEITQGSFSVRVQTPFSR